MTRKPTQSTISIDTAGQLSMWYTIHSPFFLILGWLSPSFLQFNIGGMKELFKAKALVQQGPSKYISVEKKQPIRSPWLLTKLQLCPAPIATVMKEDTMSQVSPDPLLVSLLADLLSQVLDNAEACLQLSPSDPCCKRPRTNDDTTDEEIDAASKPKRANVAQDEQPGRKLSSRVCTPNVRMGTPASTIKSTAASVQCKGMRSLLSLAALRGCVNDCASRHCVQSG
jgi:hypothetical protein